MDSANMETPGKPFERSILDTVSSQEQTAALRAFNPQGLILEYLGSLEERERQVLISRYGLTDGKEQTLENIGQRLNLTRERVRQIQKDALTKLKKNHPGKELTAASELIFEIIESQGHIALETKILETLLANNNSPAAREAILFFLNVTTRFNLFRETNLYRQSWYVSGFEQEFLQQIITAAKQTLETIWHPVSSKELFEKLRNSFNQEEAAQLNDEVLESYISISKTIDRNAFQEWGLANWTDIRPKDVGDKIFLVLLHGKKPEHYAKITELINKQGFDRRVAHKETVHNELIKDERFVLVGRGIYALREWGYKKGVVADIIREILEKAGRPLSRDEIIDEVMKQRLVKRNTIIVGLSNRKQFSRTEDNKYLNV